MSDAVTTPHRGPHPTDAVRASSAGIRFVGPNPRDVRLHQSAVLLSLQVLGQTVLGFDLSIMQILLSLATCAVIEISVRLWRDGVLAWPASALLTGNGVALILRVPGTRHGDWWSVRGWWIFVAVAAGSLLSKYVFRRGGRHIFNPSNLGLVAGFLVLGGARVDPQVLWWGDLDVGLAAAIALILIGGTVITRRLRLLSLAVTFWVVFASLLGSLAASGHCMMTPWHVGPVCGASYWWSVALSPEVFVFAMFMITDPRTTPTDQRTRLLFGVAVAVTAALLMAPQRTEFATKVALLASLTLVCAAVPAVRWLASDQRLDSIAARARRTPAVRVVAANIAVLSLGAALVTVAGTSARPDRFEARDLADPAQPVVELPDGFPTVSLDDSTRQHAPWYVLARAQQRALDLDADLELLAQAFETGDVTLARSAASGPKLAEVEAAIAEQTTTGHRLVPTYELRSITAVMVRAQRSRQPSPEVGFEIAGVLTTSELDINTSPPTLVSSTSVPVREIVRLRASGDATIQRYLIAGPGERWEATS